MFMRHVVSLGIVLILMSALVVKAEASKAKPFLNFVEDRIKDWAKFAGKDSAKMALQHLLKELEDRKRKHRAQTSSRSDYGVWLACPECVKDIDNDALAENLKTLINSLLEEDLKDSTNSLKDADTRVSDLETKAEKKN